MPRTSKPSSPPRLCKIKRVAHAPSPPCPLRGGSTRWRAYDLCHRTPRDPDGASVSRRFSWEAERLVIRLRNELSPAAWKRLSRAAERSGTDVVSLLSQHLEERP